MPKGTVPKVSMLSLGCLKNQADAERLLSRLSSLGISYTPDPASAGVIIVNTCGFIEDAKRESIDAILAMAGSRGEGQRVIVMGCLSKRYREELADEMPEVDAFFGVGEDEAIAEHILAGLKPTGASADTNPVLRLSTHSAPLKIAEGCDRGCTFCAIPSIRGPYASRPMDELIAEARMYLRAGVRELLVVAQDITRYGDKAGLAGLLDALANLSDVPDEYWVRPLYLYPTEVDSRLIETIARNPRICRYFDIPLQHSESRVLKAMGRKGRRDDYLRLIASIRKAMPEAAIRTALIVGFPGETDEDFEGLLDFVEKAGFDHMGAFIYSLEEGTKAAGYDNQVPQELAQERLSELMELQRGISRRINESLVGSTGRCLVEENGEDGLIGRLGRQAPDVDGVVLLSCPDARPGDFVSVSITGAHDYDLEGSCG